MQHLSQTALADKLGMHQRQISDLERGAVDPRLSTIQNVARALDLEIVLVPRRLIPAVEALQRGGDPSRRPMYALPGNEAFDADDEAPPEVGAAVRAGDGARRPARRKAPA